LPARSAFRAAHISRPHLQITAPAPAPKRRPRWRTPALVVGVIAVLIAVLAGVYAWTQSYYFVGRDGSEVAIFRGVNASFGPLKFYEVAANTDIKLNDLEQSSQSQVVSGIAAGSKGEARQIVARLEKDHLKPLCSDLTTPPAPPTSTALSSSATATRTPASKTATGKSKTPSHSTKRTPAKKKTPTTHPSAHTSSPAPSSTQPSSPAPTINPHDCRGPA